MEGKKEWETWRKGREKRERGREVRRGKTDRRGEIETEREREPDTGKWIKKKKFVLVPAVQHFLPLTIMPSVLRSRRFFRWESEEWSRNVSRKKWKK